MRPSAIFRAFHSIDRPKCCLFGHNVRAICWRSIFAACIYAVLQRSIVASLQWVESSVCACAVHKSRPSESSHVSGLNPAATGEASCTNCRQISYSTFCKRRTELNKESHTVPSLAECDKTACCTASQLKCGVCTNARHNLQQ